MSTELTV